MILALRSIGLLLLLPSIRAAAPSATFQFSSTGARLQLPTRASVARLGDDGSDDDAASASSSARLMLDPTLTNDRIEDLYAWIAMATQYNDARYDDEGPHALLAAVFGEIQNAKGTDEVDEVQAWLSHLHHLKEEARRRYRAESQEEGGAEEVRIGPILTQHQREQNALGPLGAGQWSGQTDEIHAHSLLRLTISHNNSHSTTAADAVEEWIRRLPRKCRQTLRKAEQNAECTQRLVVIANDKPAPQSTLAHFRCVVEHQARLSETFHQDEGEDEERATNHFFDAILEGIDRYFLSIHGCGSILEFRHVHTDQLLGFSHLVGKGNVLRGQWFYASNAGSHQFLWFQAVRYAVDRAAREEGVEVVDLGPNGTDGRLMEHADLKERYGFGMVEDWPGVADYRGPFWTV